MTAYNWGFDIANVNLVDALSMRLFSPDVSILREEEDAKPPVFHFSSHHLNNLSDPSEVQARGAMLKALLDGALYLVHGYGFIPPPLQGLWDFQRQVYLGSPKAAPSVRTFSQEHCAVPLSSWEQSGVERNFLSGSIFAARTDAVVYGMLLTLGSEGVTWRSLYALTDTMDSNGFCKEQQWQAAGSNASEYDRFKHTANSFDVLGPLARHGQKKHAPPSKPMLIERAAEIILAATRAFLNQRITRAAAGAGILVQAKHPSTAVNPTAVQPVATTEAPMEPEQAAEIIWAEPPKKSYRWIVVAGLAAVPFVLQHIRRRR